MTTTVGGTSSVERCPDGTDEPTRDRRPLMLVVHPGAIGVENYGLLRDRLAATVRTEIVEIERLAVYREAMMTGRPVPATLTEVAGRLLEQVRTHVETRPHVVLGWSFGGVVACALADLLPQEQKPRRIVALDSIAPLQGREYGDAIPDREALDWFAMYFGAKRGRPLDLGPSDFEDLDLHQGLEVVLERSVDREVLIAGTTVQGLRKVFQAFVDGMRRNKALQDTYQPHRFGVPITLVRPARGLLDQWDSLGWDDVAAGGPETLTCGGDHYTMLQEPDAVEVVARRVEAELLGP